MKNQRSPKGLIVHSDADDASSYSPERLLTDGLLSWKEFAAAIIEASGEKPERYLDHVCLAAQVKQIRKIEAYIPLVERDPAYFRVALHEAIVLASLVHHLTIVDNERSIAGDIARRKFLEDRRVAETEAARTRNRPIMERAEQLRAKGMKSDRGIAIKIAKELGGEFNTIRKAIRQK